MCTSTMVAFTINVWGLCCVGRVEVLDLEHYYAERAAGEHWPGPKVCLACDSFAVGRTDVECELAQTD